MRCKNLQELFRKTSLPFFVVIVLTVCWSSDKECDHLLTLINKETGLVIGDVKNLPMFYCNTCGNICQHVSAWFFFLSFFFLLFLSIFFIPYTLSLLRGICEFSCFQELLLLEYIRSFWTIKVHIFWEGHKILKNLHLKFDYSTHSHI